MAPPRLHRACAGALLHWALSSALVAVATADSEFASLERIRELRLSPRVVVDGGANVGDFSRAIRTIFPHTKILMIEANPHLQLRLERAAKEISNASVVISALSYSDGEVPFFISEPDSKGNSMFRENTEYFADATVKTVKAQRLDSIMHEENVMGQVDILKLDVQGAELLALQGATETLKSVSIVTLEVSLVEYNKGGACYHEIDTFLRNQGFSMYDIVEVKRAQGYYNTTGAGQIDIVWVKPQSPLVWPVLKNARYCAKPDNLSRSECPKISLQPSPINLKKSTEMPHIRSHDCYQRNGEGFSAATLLASCFVSALLGALVTPTNDSVNNEVKGRVSRRTHSVLRVGNIVGLFAGFIFGILVKIGVQEL